MRLKLQNRDKISDVDQRFILGAFVLCEQTLVGVSYTAESKRNSTTRRADSVSKQWLRLQKTVEQGSDAHALTSS